MKAGLEETVRRQTADLVEAQKLDSIGRLAAGVAHDFNNLLVVMKGAASLLARALAPSSPLERHVTQISNACEQAQALTGQLLAFGRRQTLNPVTLDLNALVEDVKTMLPTAPGIELVTRLDPAGAPILADAAQMRQVIMNLVVNARHAMSAGGRLTIETRHDLSALGNHVVLIVADTGVGIPPEDQVRIFEPFFTTKGPAEGTGLGLATVYGIVQQSGGSIRVTSEAGKGTSFLVFLPRASRDMAAALTSDQVSS